MISTSFVCENLLRELTTYTLVHFIQSKMATKFKMAAIYQNMACRCGKLLFLIVKCLKSVRYGFENDAKHLTSVQQKIYTV